MLISQNPHVTIFNDDNIAPKHDVRGWREYWTALRGQMGFIQRNNIYLDLPATWGYQKRTSC